MKSECRNILPLLLSLVWASSLSGQSGSSPEPGDPAVFYLFLRHVDGLAAAIRAAASQSPGEADASRSGAAASIGVSVADFSKIDPVYQQLIIALDAINTDANGYRDELIATGKRADPATMKSFTDRRNAAIQNASNNLAVAISGSGWAAVSAYVEGPFRHSITAVRSAQ